MAQLASLASIVGAGASIYGNVRAAQEQSKLRKAQNAAIAQQNAARAQELQIQRDADARDRQLALARTIAAARARLAAGGVQPNEGSAAALSAGPQTEAAADQSSQDSLLQARIAQGRRSLLNPDGTLTAFLRSGRNIGTVARNLLD